MSLPLLGPHIARNYETHTYSHPLGDSIEMCRSRTHLAVGFAFVFVATLLDLVAARAAIAFFRGADYSAEHIAMVNIMAALCRLVGVCNAMVSQFPFCTYRTFGDDSMIPEWMRHRPMRRVEPEGGMDTMDPRSTRNNHVLEDAMRRLEVEGLPT